MASQISLGCRQRPDKTPHYQLWLKENNLFDEAARAYLAAASYADACLGVILEALKESPHYQNTIDDRWRYIRYGDGTQELYDLQDDPQEWSNLAADPSPEASAAMKRLGDVIPKTFAKAIPRSKGKYKKATGIDRTMKATRDLSKLK